MAPPHKSITSHSVFPLTLLYDGACDVCAHEMDDLKARDRDKRLIFVDITHPRFDPTRYGAQLHELRAQIHAVRPDGRLLRGVSVLHVAYAAVGRGWMFAPVRWPLLKPAMEATYRLLSRHRDAISKAVAPWLFKLWDRRARGTLQRMQDTCISEYPVSVFLPLAEAHAMPLRTKQAPAPEKELVLAAGDEEQPPEPAAKKGRSSPTERPSSSLWQDTLPAINSSRPQR